MWTLENISQLLKKEVYIYSKIYIYILKQYGLTEVSGQSAEDPTVPMCYNSDPNFIPHLADLHDNHLQRDKNLLAKISEPFVTDALWKCLNQVFSKVFFHTHDFVFLDMSYTK